MLLLGIDLGTSSIKVSVLDSATGIVVSSASYPETESEIIALQAGWAEQLPEVWWQNVKQAIKKCNASTNYNSKDVAAIGIAYQMHGLVIVNQKQESLRNSIIWCDSRAVEIGDKALVAIGKEKVLNSMLNSPGNFTASKLAWVKENEPDVYQKIDKMMLPGDFIAMKLSGNITTSASSLSEGILWDFKKNEVSEDILNHFEFDGNLIPALQNVFSNHGELTTDIANDLGLTAGIPVSYKAGDQPNNALSLNVSEPGEVAATAGTSGVIYGISDSLKYDKQSRVNTFAHVNHTENNPRLGVLLCINGVGSMNRWAKNTFANNLSYNEINNLAAQAKEGSEGISVLPFGNGAERMLNNKNVGAHIENLEVNRHQQKELLRAVQEGIAFSFRYGFDILTENGVTPQVIRAGKANLFLSDLFAQTFVNIIGVPVELYENDGSVGAAIGAGIGIGVYTKAADAFAGKKALKLIEPKLSNIEDYYQNWKEILSQKLNK